MKIARALVVLLAFAVVGSLNAAVPPYLVNYQGVLRDSVDNPLDGTYDMVFRLYDPGDLLLVTDEHRASGSGAVVVRGGMFTVFLGGGTLVPGASPSFPAAFAAYEEVYLEVQVGTEILAPRTRILAAPYAHNADTLDGLSSASFSPVVHTHAGTDITGKVGDSDRLDGLDSTAFSMTGHIHAGTDITGKVGDADRLDGLDSTAFSLTGHPHAGTDITGKVGDSDRLDGLDSTAYGLVGSNNSWSGANTFARTPVSNSMYGGSIIVNPPSSAANYTLLGMGIGGAERFRVDAEGDVVAGGQATLRGSSPSLLLQDAAGTSPLTDLYANDSLNYTYLYDYQNSRYLLYGSADGIGIGTSSVSPSFVLSTPSLRITTGWLGLNNRLDMNSDGPEGSQWIYFYNGGSSTGESLGWDDAQDRFEMTDELAVSGPLEVGSSAAGTLAYSRFGASGTATSSTIDSTSDVFVADSLELNGDLFAGNRIYMNYDGAAADQFLYFYDAGSPVAEALYWSVSRFTVSDDLRVEGTFTATGTKNFVQNHPYDPALSVVYTALEGDEAGTYTRGSGRLVNGEARVALGKTFALVTNPEIGLTAHVTPRGAWADLYVASIDTGELVVRSRDSRGNAEFDYIVHGLRIGYEDFRAVQPRTGESPVPSESYYARQREERPDLARFAARARFASERPVGSATVGDPSPASALRAAIGEYDPDVDDPNREARLGGDARADTKTAAPTPHEMADAEVTTAVSEAPATAVLAPAPEEPAAGRESPWPTFPVSEAVEVGDVLVLDPEHPGMLRRAATIADRNVVGVAAGDPLEIDGRLVVALVDSLFATVRVDASYGAIRPGDLLTTSATPGCAMFAFEPQPGAVLGKALEPLASGTGRIRMLVMPR